MYKKPEKESSNSRLSAGDWTSVALKRHIRKALLLLLLYAKIVDNMLKENQQFSLYIKALHALNTFRNTLVFIHQSSVVGWYEKNN